MLATTVRMSQIKKGIPSYYVMAQDSDFSGTSNGKFKYIGSHEYVIIPHVIKGRNVTSYKEMFYDNTSTILKGVASDNLNVTVMEGMFYGSRATALDLSSFNTSNVTNMSLMFAYSKVTTLDLSSFNTSKVTDMSLMFYLSKTTTGYARTQADADKFNASAGKPADLTFVVK